jgi:transcriptional regulator with XRE-family HTH domain
VIPLSPGSLEGYCPPSSDRQVVAVGSSSISWIRLVTYVAKTDNTASYLALGRVTVHPTYPTESGPLNSSDAPSLKEYGEALAQVRNAAGLTQHDVGQKLGVSRATIAQWETGRHLPSRESAKALDTVLLGDGALLELAERARRRHRTDRRYRPPVLSPPPREAQPSVLEVFRDVGDALIAKLTDRGDVLGWRHELADPNDDVTALATAYGAKTLLLLQSLGTRGVDFGRIAAALRDWEGTDERRGWTAASSVKPTPEVTAVVLDALCLLDPAYDPGQYEALLLDMMGPFEKRRPAIISTVLETVLRVWPDSKLAGSLVADLLDARIKPESQLWPERSDPWLVLPKPSVLHTARAIRALKMACRQMPKAPDEAFKAVELATPWLSEQQDLRSVGETLTRKGGDKSRVKHVIAAWRHFTAAWVARALVEVGEYSASNVAATEANSEIWRAFNNELSLWMWRSGDLPIWMTYDAIEALTLVALSKPSGQPLVRSLSIAVGS